jgi:hypothetical protein
MPTISQLPSANPVSAADELPISQGGTARATSVGALLAATQPAIIVDSPSLLGRTSIGSGGPEQVGVGIGMTLAGGTLVANGSDHAIFPRASSLPIQSDLVVSNLGSPTLVQTALLRGLFSAGQNVAIDASGVISATGAGTLGGGGSIGELQTVTSLAARDLVAVSHAGADYAIAYSNLLGGVTIDQAQPAAAAADPDTIWTAQGSNVMVSQTFGAIWVWIANKLPTHKAPVVEITVNTILDATVHNGRILVCSQPVTVSPLVSNMGSGFQCIVINASAGNVTLGSSFVSSSGSFLLASWQSATLSCASYSAGIIAFAAMPAAASGTTAPGQAGGLSISGITATTISITWQAASSGGVVASYIVQFRPTGTTSWSSSTPVVGATAYQLSALQSGTSYDIAVAAQNATGIGAASAILTAVTANVIQPTPPPQVTGLTVTPTSGSIVQVNWTAQAGTNAATGFTVQYRVTGVSGWTSSVAGMTGTGGTLSGLQPVTSYDFSVIGVNSAGAGSASTVVTAVTLVPSASVTSISWNLVPNGTYTHGSGEIGVNAQVSPADSAIQFGFSLSATVPPSSWTAATHVNSNLWGAYVVTPAAAGTWYAWAEGLDGSALVVSSSPFVVQ